MTKKEGVYKYLESCGMKKRQAWVAEAVARGLKNKEIADELFVTKKTISYHMSNILKTFKIKNRYELIEKIRMKTLKEKGDKNGKLNEPTG